MHDFLCCLQRVVNALHISDIGELQLPVSFMSRADSKIIFSRGANAHIFFMAVMLRNDGLCNICINTTELALRSFLSIRKPILSIKDKNNRFLLPSSFIIVQAWNCIIIIHIFFRYKTTVLWCSCCKIHSFVTAPIWREITVSDYKKCFHFFIFEFKTVPKILKKVRENRSYIARGSFLEQI
jgi:hypothetical protein